MFKFRTAVLFSLACLFSSDAWSITGVEIYQGCSVAAQEDFNYESLPTAKAMYVGHCLGLITGFVEMIRLYEGTEAPPVACIPDNVTVSTIVDDVIDFLDENRAHWDMSASVLVIIAIKNNYLCEA